MFNNAGLMPLSELHLLKVAEWERMIDVNIKGVLYGIAAALPIMHQQGGGQIIATDSVAGHFVHPNTAVYAGTKFAVRTIMEGLRQEEGKNHIRAMIVSPGAVETELYSTITDPAVRENTYHNERSYGLKDIDVAMQSPTRSTNQKTLVSTKFYCGRLNNRYNLKAASQLNYYTD